MKVDENNICTKSDSYKVTHHKQTPPGVTKVYSYLESRGGEYDYTEFYGLQYIIKKHLTGQQVTKANIDMAELFWNAHFGYQGLFNREMWEHIEKEHDGYIPLKIKAVPEGTVVPVKNVLATFENTDDKCASLTNFLESILLEVWAPITVATNSRTIKVEMLKRILKTTEMTFEEANEAVAFMLHDFGFRGVSSYESSAILGSAHLTNFMGTDTVSGIILLMNYYNAEMCGFSVVASEHSTATPWGRDEGEKAYIMNMLKKHPEVIVSAISDSYDVFAFVEMCTTDEDILALYKYRTEGKLVFRPDSGDPVAVCRAILRIIEKNLGVTLNGKGYKVLPSYVGCIQGDGIDKATVNDLLDMLEEENWIATTLNYGSDGGLLQKFNRDTQKFAIKCSFMVQYGQEVNVQKDPITAPGKKSKTGQLKLIKSIDDGDYMTISSNDYPETFDDFEDEMVTVFENGKMLVEYTLDEIRERAQVQRGEVASYLLNSLLKEMA